MEFDGTYFSKLCDIVSKTIVEAFENLTIEDINMYQLGYNKAYEELESKYWDRMYHVENNIRNKVIDEFIEKVELKYLGVHPDELYEKYYPREICKQIKEIAEQLKAGASNGTDNQ